MFKKKTIQIPLQPKAKVDYHPSPVWQQSQELTSQTKKLMRTPEMQAILELLRRETPKQLIQLPLNASESEQLRLASLEDGYYICLNKLLSLQHYVEDAQELEATFEER
jgi:hypothetical protein